MFLVLMASCVFVLFITYYFSMMLPPHTPTIQKHLQNPLTQVAELLEEYLDSGDIDEAAQSLQELDLPRYDHWFVKRAITLAMDRHDREREMVSVLLSALYSEVVSADQMARGLHDVLDALDDLTLDVPDASDQLATFIARAVVDDILPPSFVARLPNGACGGTDEMGAPGHCVAAWHGQLYVGSIITACQTRNACCVPSYQNHAHVHTPPHTTTHTTSPQTRPRQDSYAPSARAT